MSAELLSYHGRPDLKAERISMVRAHRQADLLMQKETGDPSKGQKGCAVACTVNGYDHYRYAPELGLSPAWAFLEDAVFEGLSVMDSQWWPEAFLTAVPVGKDLWPAYHRVTQRILLEVALPNVRACNEPEPSATNIENAIRQCAALYEQAAKGETESPTRAYWRAFAAAESAARSAAESAAGSAAWSAAESAAESAAGSAAESAAESAARSAARSAAESAARSVARSAAYKRIADIIIEELEREEESA